MDIEKVLSEMTLEEKAGMLSGADSWHTKAVDRLGVPSVMMTDGPHGVRKMSAKDKGVNSKIKTTAFPTASMVACSWDPVLVREMGIAIADEARANNVSIVLGPGANIKRSPLCGRNFEYFSEDPLLSGVMAGNFIDGVQSRGVGTSLKHFACNNQEYMRMICSSNVDDRSLRDIYIKSFENAIRVAKPDTVMCAYNKINGVYCSENRQLLTEILRDDIGFDGVVMSDWGAVGDRVSGVIAGLELEMPSSSGVNDRKIVKAVREGRLDISVVDEAVRRMLRLVDKVSYINDLEEDYSVEKHADLAVKIAEQSAVLLENRENILPLHAGEKILIVGNMAKKSRYQGGGSSHITPHYVTSLCDGLDSLGVCYDYIDGYYDSLSRDNEKLIAKAISCSQSYDKVIVCVGLPESMEVEGLDRSHINLPLSHDRLVQALSAVHSHVAVVVTSGSPVAMPWRDRVQGILMMYLAGNNGGMAAAKILTGRVNPCGRLAETFPVRLEDCGSYHDYYHDRENSYYAESVYVGYRYYDTAGVDVAYPFGYGLSYTDFAYSDIAVDRERMDADGVATVSVTVTNTGATAGRETVQLYIGKEQSVAFRPTKELKAFKKIYLEAGESRRVTFEISRRELEIYDIDTDTFVVEGGRYVVFVGKNVRDIECIVCFAVDSDEHLHADSRELEWYHKPDCNIIPRTQFELLYGGKVNGIRERHKKGEFVASDCIEDIAAGSGVGKIIMFFGKIAVASASGGKKSTGYLMALEFFKGTPLYKMAEMSQGGVTDGMLDGILMTVNGHLFKGIGKILSNLPNKKSRE